MEEEERKGGGRGFVRVARRIRQSRGRMRRTVARAGAASAPPATPSRMDTHLWEFLRDVADHWRSNSHTSRTRRVFASIYPRSPAKGNVGSWWQRERERRRSASVDSAVFFHVGDEKALSYNCCTPRAAPPVSRV